MVITERTLNKRIPMSDWNHHDYNMMDCIAHIFSYHYRIKRNIKGSNPYKEIDKLITLNDRTVYYLSMQLNCEFNLKHRMNISLKDLKHFPTFKNMRISDIDSIINKLSSYVIPFDEYDLRLKVLENGEAKFRTSPFIIRNDTLFECRPLNERRSSDGKLLDKIYELYFHSLTGNFFLYNIMSFNIDYNDENFFNLNPRTQIFRRKFIFPRWNQYDLRFDTIKNAFNYTMKNNSDVKSSIINHLSIIKESGLILNFKIMDEKVRIIHNEFHSHIQNSANESIICANESKSEKWDNVNFNF